MKQKQKTKNQAKGKKGTLLVDKINNFITLKMDFV